jgi:hypothetical protein
MQNGTRRSNCALPARYVALSTALIMPHIPLTFSGVYAHGARFGLGWKYSSCVVFARSSSETAVASISNSFAAHSYTKYGSSSRFESRIIRLRPAGCAADGGSAERKIRFAVEVASAVADEIGAERTGIRISPGNTFNDIVENDVYTVYGALIRELSRLGLAYLHVAHMGDEGLLRKIRGIWPGVIVLNRGGADLPTRIEDIENGIADVIAVGSMSLANPDLVERIKRNVPLNSPDLDILRRRDKRLHGLPNPRDDGTSIRSRGSRLSANVLPGQRPSASYCLRRWLNAP